MADEKILIGSDHAGLAMKYELIQALRQWGLAVDDLGCYALADGEVNGLTYDPRTGTLAAGESVDYPDYALKVAEAVAAADGGALGLLICGSGVGMAITANKVCGIRAALCHDPYASAMARAHNDANVLCLGGRVIGPELAKAVVRAFVDGRFEGGRHARRVDKIRAIEAKKLGCS